MGGMLTEMAISQLLIGLFPKFFHCYDLYLAHLKGLAWNGLILKIVLNVFLCEK